MSVAGLTLGSGAFGIVRRGIAHGLVPGEAETTVAVKMTRRANEAAIRALAAELKVSGSSVSLAR